MDSKSVAMSLLKELEGCKLKSYKDIKGIYTIGYGATGSDIDAYTVWTQAEADLALEQRVDVLRRLILNRAVPILTANQLAALVCLVYNIGITAFYGSKLLKAINLRQDPSELWMQWDHVLGQESKGLRKRRETELTLYKS
jgi:lysozyme